MMAKYNTHNDMEDCDAFGPSQEKAKTPNFDVKEKIKELMATPSPKTNARKKFFKSKKISKKDFNRGVSHSIKTSKPVKAKVQKLNKAKQVISRIKEVEMPPRLAINRVPLKLGGKAKIHKLSSPGVSYLNDSLEEENDIKAGKFFTSRSQSGISVKINNNIKLLSVNGQIKMKTKENHFQKKNIGRAVEIELEKQIATDAVKSPVDNIQRLEKARQLSSSISTSPALKPTRFPGGSPSPKKHRSKDSPMRALRKSPRKQPLADNGQLGSPRRSPRKLPYSTPQKENINSPSRISRKSPLKPVNSETILNLNSPRRTPRKVLNDLCKENSSPKKNGSIPNGIHSPKRAVNAKTIDDSELQDLESVFEELDSESSQEDEILTTILKENQSPDKVLGTPKRSPRKRVNSPKPSNVKPVNVQSPRSGKNVKYFPIFEPRNAQMQLRMKNGENSLSMIKQSKGLRKRMDKNQMTIDAGQKNYGATFCKECGTLYDPCDTDDNTTHQEIHNNLLKCLKYTSWKNEDQVTDLDSIGGRVIRVTPDKSNNWWRKIEEILECVDRDLGFSENGIRCRSNTTVFFYVLDKEIAGILVSEGIQKAYKVIPQEDRINSDSNQDMSKLICCSETPQKVSFGISRIWVVASQRRKKVASKLVTAMRSNLVPYHYLSVEDFAFSDPTTFGMKFAESYTRKRDFLVYRRE